MYHHLNMVLCGPDEQPQWNDYVQRSSHATVAHAFAWSAVIRQAYGHRAFYLMAEHDGIVKGIFPLILVKGWRAATLASMPFMDYGGICADDAVTVQRLLDSGLALMREHRCTSLEVRQVEPIIEVGATRLDKVTMLLDLTGGAERLWQSFPAKVRNQVRKAEKAGLTTMMGGAELLNEFYEVFVVNMRDLGSPVHGRQFFESMASEFGPRLRVILVRDGHDTIGGGIALSFKETMLVPWASSLREHRSKCPNNLLYWEAFQFGCKQGCKTFDFGRSSVGSGTYEFKKQWGAQPVTLHWQVLKLNGGAETTISSEDAAYRFAAQVWRRLPVAVTRVVGPRIRKYLTN